MVRYVNVSNTQLLSKGAINYSYYFVFTMQHRNVVDTLLSGESYYNYYPKNVIDSERIKEYMNLPGDIYPIFTFLGGPGSYHGDCDLYPLTPYRFGRCSGIFRFNYITDKRYLIELKIPKDAGILTDGYKLDLNSGKFYNKNDFISYVLGKTEMEFDCGYLDPRWVTSIYEPSKVTYNNEENNFDTMCTLYTPIYKTKLSFSQKAIRLAGDGYGEPNHYREFYYDNWVDTEPWWFNRARCKRFVYRSNMHRILTLYYGDHIPPADSKEFSDILINTDKIIYNDIYL